MLKKYFHTTFTPQVAIPGFIFLFGLSLLCGLFPQKTEELLQIIQKFIYDNLSWLYVFTVSFILIFLLVIALSKMGNIRLGPDNSRPQYGFFSWIAMLFAAGMGIGLMYFGVTEPLSHFANPALQSTMQRAKEAQLDTFFHWGIHAWGIYAIVGLILAYFSYRYKLPLSIRSGLYPLIKSRINGPIGAIVDVFALCSTFFGLATSLGFGVVQLNSGLVYLKILPQSNFFYQAIIIIVVTSIAVMSTLSGINKGVKRLSEINISLAVALMFFVLILGPTVYIFSAFSEGIGHYFNNLIDLTFDTFAFEKEGRGWFTNWTVMYWAWWISWSPFVGLFIARISRGRTIREFIFVVLLIPSFFIFLWMTVFGNGAIWVDKNIAHGSLSAMVGHPDILLFKFFDYFPLSTILSVIAVLVIILFFVTSADSGILVMNNIVTHNHPKSPKWQSVFWGFLLIILSLGLLNNGGLRSLQTMTLITALPFGVIILVLCYCLLIALHHDRQAHDASFPYGSRNWDGSHWEQRLDQILTFSKKEDIQHFMHHTVLPAFEQLRDALEKKGIDAEIGHNKKRLLSLELIIRYDKVRNFRYGVMAEVKTISDYLIDDENMPDVESNKTYLPVTYYNDGRRGNDIQYLNKEEIIADVLREYERFIVLIADGKDEMLVED